MAEGHIILDGVRKSFGAKHVLNGINLSVQKGHSLVVIGGSGTGKSVMLKCILGILHRRLRRHPGRRQKRCRPRKARP